MDWRNKTVIIDIGISYKGKYAEQDLIDKWSDEIKRAWEGNGTYYKDWNIKINIRTEIVGWWNFFGPSFDNVIEVRDKNYTPWPGDNGPGGDVTWGETTDTGNWSSGLVAKEMWVVGHEAGHLFGLDDYYNSTPPDFSAYKGFDGTIMGVRYGSANEPSISGRSFKDFIISDVINNMPAGGSLNKLITGLPATSEGINRFIDPGKRESQTPVIMRAGDFRFLR